MVIVLHLLGKTRMERDGAALTFPTRKAGSIVLYAALNGGVSRENLTSMFWKDKDKPQAMANLRNAIYTIRRIIPENIRINRRRISITDFITDMDNLNDIADTSNPIPDTVFQPPLGDISTSDSDDFSEWAEMIRERLREDIRSALRGRVAHSYKVNSFDDIEESLKALLAVDPYDEESVLELMEAYKNSGQFAKAVSCYNNYTSSLENRLGIQPSERAAAFFKKIVISGAMHSPDIAERNKFWHRKDELSSMINSLTSRDGSNSVIFVYGEVGMGKTMLINRVVSLMGYEHERVLNSIASEISKNYDFAAWNNIMQQTGAAMETAGISASHSAQSILGGIFPGFPLGSKLNYNADYAKIAVKSPVAISEIIIELLGKIYTGKRFIIVFEDIHWFDDMSMQLLASFLAFSRINADIIISGRPESRDTAAKTLLPAAQANSRFSVTTVTLKPFSGYEVNEICRSSLPREAIESRDSGYFLRESEGVPLLLFEMLHTLEENPVQDCTSGLCGLIMGRIGCLTDIQKEILEVLAVFGTGAEPQQTAEATGCTMADILPSFETLASKCLVKEKLDGNHIVWDFTHPKIGECIYNSISLLKRRELHGKAAEVLSRRYSPHRWDPELSAMIHRHYRLAGQKELELRQYLRELILEISLNHDLFPVMSDNVLLGCSSPFCSRSDTEEKIKNAMAALNDLRENGTDDKDLAPLEASCFELTGGYHISWGEYEKGKAFIGRSVRISDKHGFLRTRMHCLKHLSYMYLQLEDYARLRSSARSFLKFSQLTQEEQYTATAIRLIGMSYFLEGELDTAEKIFRYSIKLFEALQLTGRSYTLGHLVAISYIGDICQIRGDYKQALSYFTYCLNTCDSTGLFWGRSYFHMRAADAAFDTGRDDLFFKHIDKAVSLFESCQGGRCGSMLYSLKAIADARRGNIKEAVRSLGRAELLIGNVSRRLWLATQYMAKATVTGMMDGKMKLMYNCKMLNTFSRDEYLAEATRLLSEYGMKERALRLGERTCSNN